MRGESNAIMNERGQRGFLLLLIVSLLAVLLVVIVGFLSFTRTELTAVAHVRDRADSSDLAQSAVDWTMGNIASYIFDPNTKNFDPAKYVSNANDSNAPPSGGGGQWWYAPYDPDVKTINNAYQWGWSATYMQQNCAAWKYMPDNFFPDGSIAGRFAVQVLDANSVININDWNEDCNPTQCQMAHMIQSAQGLNYFEGYRAHQDNNGDNVITTIPYFQGWSVASRTVRYFKYNWSYTGNYTNISPNYITTNTSWLGMFGPEYVGMKNTYYDQYLGWWWGQPWWDQCGMASFSLVGYVDPDTGRSPMNVNTCEVSGNCMPFSGENYTCTWPLEGVFNIESLARIIKIGKFYYNGKLYDAQAHGSPVVPDTRWNTAPPPPLPDSAAAWQHAECLKLRLAYRYQEMMVRYFCGKYKPYVYGNNYGYFDGNWHMQLLFRKGAPGDPYDGFVENRSYYQAFTNNAAQGAPQGALTTAETSKVKHAVLPDGTSPADQYPQNAYYTKTRFPCSLDTFRQWVADDFIAMTQNNRAWGNGSVVANSYGHDGGNGPYSTTFTLAYGDGNRTQIQPYDDDDPCVNFDSLDTPDVIPGKMDKRTAEAIFDNMIPGKLWKDANGAQHYLLFGDGYAPYSPSPVEKEYGDQTGNAVRDPLWELYCYQVGRDEYDFCQNNRQNFYSTGTGNSVFNEKGHDIRLGDSQIAGNTMQNTNVKPPTDLGAYDQRGSVPWRQLAFGPDWFSTELTTTSPTYYFVVTSEIVDKASAKNNPNAPTVLTHHMALVCVEMAPDVEAETDPSYDGSGWPTGGVPLDPTHAFTTAELKKVGLGYYRGGWPQKMKAAPSANPNSMDAGMQTASQVAGAQNYKPALPDTMLTSYPSNTSTAVPTAWSYWMDFRGVKQGDEKTFYKPQVSPGDKSKQTSSRAIVRWTWTINQGL